MGCRLRLFPNENCLPRAKYSLNSSSALPIQDVRRACKLVVLYAQVESGDQLKKIRLPRQGRLDLLPCRCDADSEHCICRGDAKRNPRPSRFGLCIGFRGICTSDLSANQFLKMINTPMIST